jgi:hypothetical protein
MLLLRNEQVLPVDLPGNVKTVSVGNAVVTGVIQADIQSV